MQELKEQLRVYGPAVPTSAKKAARPAAPPRNRAAPDADASGADDGDVEDSDAGGSSYNEEPMGCGAAAATPVAQVVNAACVHPPRIASVLHGQSWKGAAVWLPFAVHCPQAHCPLLVGKGPSRGQMLHAFLCT